MSQPGEIEITAEQYRQLIHQQTAQGQFQLRYQDEIRASRRAAMIFGSVICTCPPWHRNDAISDMQNCVMHGQYIIDDNGEVI